LGEEGRKGKRKMTTQGRTMAGKGNRSSDLLMDRGGSTKKNRVRQLTSVEKSQRKGKKKQVFWERSKKGPSQRSPLLYSSARELEAKYKKRKKDEEASKIREERDYEEKKKPRLRRPH